MCRYENIVHCILNSLGCLNMLIMLFELFTSQDKHPLYIHLHNLCKRPNIPLAKTALHPSANVKKQNCCRPRSTTPSHSWAKYVHRTPLDLALQKHSCNFANFRTSLLKKKLHPSANRQKLLGPGSTTLGHSRAKYVHTGGTYSFYLVSNRSS